MISYNNPQSSYALPYALCALLLLFSAFAMYRLSLRLMGQIHHHGAEELLRAGYPGLALGRFKKAVDHLSGDPEIHNSLGQVYFNLGALKRNAEDASGLTLKSRESHKAAAALNPLDAHAAYGIARSEDRLAELYQYRHPENKDIPYAPGPYFEEAIRLRPNGIFYRYAYARHLFKNGKLEDLTATVRKLSRTYPPAYHHLRGETFWSAPIKEACRVGLESAIKENISPRTAHMALSSMLARDGQWPESIQQYKTALGHKGFDNNAGNYAHLGGLYLKNGEFEEARPCLFHALAMSRKRDRLMTKLYHLYRREKESERFEAFYREADRTFILPAGTEIVLARTLMDLKQYNQARRILKEMVQKRPDAEGYYWLARIARVDKNWDEMELSIQKATVLDPENSAYHSLFSQALKRKKKLKRAKKEAALARKYKK